MIKGGVKKEKKVSFFCALTSWRTRPPPPNKKILFARHEQKKLEKASR